MLPQDFLLSSYRRMLETALASGYSFASYADIGKEKGPLTCLLRHDVDAEIHSLGPMMEIEKALSIRSTWFLMARSTAYNLLSIEASRVVHRLIEDGHRIGLHFMGELCEHDSVEALVDKIRSEADWLEREFGTTLRVVSFHQPSRAILEGKIEVPGLVNTYNAAQMGSYFYVSDTNMIWQRERPGEIFERKLHPRLQLLLHPIWWTEKPLDVIGKWRAVLEANRRALVEHWQARERTLSAIDPQDLGA